MSPPTSGITDFRLLSPSVSDFMTSFSYVRHNIRGFLPPFFVTIFVAMTMFPVSIGAAAVIIAPDDISSRRAVPRDCAPVPHDTLWLRYNLESSSSSNTYVDYQRDDGDDEEISENFRPVTSKKSTSANTRRTSSRRRRRDDAERHQRQRTEVLTGLPNGDYDDAEYDSDSAAASMPTDNNSTLGAPRLRRYRRKTSHRREYESDAAVRAASGVAGADADLQQQQQQQPPWHCHMETEWKKQPEGTFPRYLQTGKCRQKRCMAGYECRPRKYATRVLRRLEGRCNPVVAADGRVAYEEAWVVDEVRVTVGCECSRKRPAGTYGGVLLGGPYYR